MVLLRALGLEKDVDLVNSVSEENDIQFLLIDDIQTSEITTTYDAIKYIGNRVAKGMTEEYRIKRAEDVIDRYLLPHMGVESDKRADKATYLAEMTEMLLQVIFDEREPHDMDHYANKRLRVSGDLMEDLFWVAFTSLTRDMTYQLERSLTRGKEPSVKQTVTFRCLNREHQARYSHRKLGWWTCWCQSAAGPYQLHGHPISP